MSSTPPLTPAERIALVEKDRARRYGQIIIALILIVFSIVFLTWYALFKADSNFLLYFATGLLALVFAGIGAAYAIFGLGRTVGANQGSNSELVALLLEEIKN